MAQRKKGSAVRGKTTRGRAPAVKGKPTKRSSAKASSQKKAAKAKTKRIVAKVITPKKPVPRKQPKELPIEVVRVEQIDEPAPGVVVVSEYESAQADPTQVTAVPGELK